MRQLEESLDAQLFDRSGRKTRLTEAGGVYLRYALRAAQELREGKRAIHDVGDLHRGTLRIAVTPTFTTYLVGPLVEAFYSRYPNITLNVHELAQEHMDRARNLYSAPISRATTRLAVFTMPVTAFETVNNLFGSDNVEELAIGI